MLSKLSSLQHRYPIIHRTINATTLNIRRIMSTTNLQTPSMSAQKDCVRLGFTYGMIGTVCSYLHLDYNKSTLIFKFEVPTPERFVFCTWCWVVAGMACWLIFWSRGNAYLLATHRVLKYGLRDGLRASAVAMTAGCCTISCWSLYFDYAERYGQTSTPGEEFGLPTNAHLDTLSAAGAGAGGATPSFGDDESDSDTSIHRDTTLAHRGVNTSDDPTLDDDVIPPWNWRVAKDNIWAPTKVFLKSHFPIWLCLGVPAGVLAARIMTLRYMSYAATVQSAGGVGAGPGGYATAQLVLFGCAKSSSQPSEIESNDDHIVTQRLLPLVMDD